MLLRLEVVTLKVTIAYMTFILTLILFWILFPEKTELNNSDVGPDLTRHYT